MEGFLRNDKKVRRNGLGTLDCFVPRNDGKEASLRDDKKNKNPPYVANPNAMGGTRMKVETLATMECCENGFGTI